MKLRPLLAAVGVGGALIAAIWGATLHRTLSEREAALNAVNEANANLALAYAENTRARLGEVDRMLQLLSVEYAAEGAEIGKVIDRWPLDADLIRWLAIFDRHGRLLFSSKHPPPWDGVTERDFFTVHREGGPPDALFLGRSEQHYHPHTEWSMVLSRRYRLGDGSFDGIVAAEIDPAKLSSFQHAIDLGRNGGVTLLGLDGFVRLRVSGHRLSYGQDLRDSPVMEALAARDSGDLLGRGRFDGVQRQFSFRRMSHYPMAVAVGIDIGDVFAAADERRRMYQGIAALMTVVVLSATFGVAQSFARQRHLLDSLAASAAEARRTQAELRGILESVDDGIIVYDRQLRIVSVNPAVERLLGVERASLIGKPGIFSVFSCVREDGAPLSQEDRPSHITARTGRPQRGLLLGLRRATGHTQWISANTAFVRGGDPDDWTGIVSTLTDVTATRQAQETLRQSEALFRATFQQSVVGMGHADVHGRILRVNRRLEEMLGYAEGELPGLHVDAILDPANQAETRGVLGALVRHPEIGGTRPSVQRFHRKDGSTVWGLTAVTLLRDAQGAPAYFLGMIQDVTELKRTEQMKDEFVSAVSHELRTPLTSIRGSLGLIAGGIAGPLPEQAGKLVRVAVANCERLIRLVNDILDMNRLASGRMQFDLRVCEVAPLLAGVVAENEGFARVHEVTLRLETAGAPPACRVDPDRLNQAVTNLVSNAVKYSPAGEAVVVRLGAREGRALIEVTDRGPGIPAEFRDRIFQRFSQAEGTDARRKSGTGLGLSIAKALVEQMGGRIGYRTEAGEGTTFFLELPAAADAPSPATTAAGLEAPA